MAGELTEYKKQLQGSQPIVIESKKVLQSEKESQMYTTQKVDDTERQVAESEQALK